MMTDGNRFTARILETSAPGLAGYTVAAMLADTPELEERYGADALDLWKTHLTHRIRELAAALDTGRAEVFTSRVLWSRRAFAARGREVSDLSLALTSLREVLGEKLPPAAATSVLDHVDRALTALAGGASQDESSGLEPQDRHQRMALRYLEDILSGRAREALVDLAAAQAGGMAAVEIISRVLLPAQREIGRLWHLGKATIAEEHMVTATTRRAMAMVSISAKPEPANGKTLVAAAVAGNAHDVSLRAVSDAFELAGWKVVYLGEDVPVEEVASTIAVFQADLLLLSVMLSTHLTPARSTIEAARARAGEHLKILVGGAVFDDVPDVWRQIGADGSAVSIEAALGEAARLVGLDAGQR